MKLKLKVLNPKKKKLSIKDFIEKKMNIKDRDDRWNSEEEVEVPERLILQLIEELIDKIIDSNKLYYYEKGDNCRSLQRDVSFGEANEFVRETRAWKKLHIIISDLGFQTSRFTRLSLFEILLNIPEMKQRMYNKLKDIENEQAGKKIPEQKEKKITEQTKPITKESIISDTIISEFFKKIKQL